MAVRSVRLTQAPTIQQLVERRKAAEIPGPDQRMYGVFGPSYASYLAATAQDQGPGASAALAALNAGALRNNARNEAEQYAAMLTRAQDLSRQAGLDAQFGDLQTEVAKRGPDWMDRGSLGVETIEIDEQGRPYITYDPVHQQVGNANVLNNDQAERLEKQATAVKTLGEAGYAPTPDYVSELITPPTQVERVPIDTDFRSPSQKIAEYSANEGLSFEERLELAKAGGSGEDGDDYADYEIVYDRGEQPIGLKYKGTPEQIQKTQDKLRSMGINPQTGQPLETLNPNAGTNGGDVPANQPPKKTKTTEKVDLVPSDGFFAPDKITSKKGMRKHPILGVNRMHNGDDYAYPKGTPIPAERNGTVLFAGPVKGFGNQVKVRYEDGSVVSYSHNASNDVKIGDKVRKGQVLGKVGSTGLSSGNHVHREVHSQGNPEKVYATRLKNHPLVADVKVEGDTTIVTTKSGKVMKFQKGRQVG